MFRAVNEDRVTQPSSSQNALPAPSAPRRPHTFTTHGITVTDDYAWLKDARWQEVLRDPSILDPDIRKYLEQRGFEPSGISAAEFRTFIANETAKWRRVIADANIKAE